MRRRTAGLVLAVAVTAGLFSLRAAAPPAPGGGREQPATQDLLVPVPVGSPDVRDDCGYRGLTGCGGSAVRTRPAPSPP